jgi:hypothetical protein
MNTWTVAYVTQMVSKVAVMAGERHHGSLRSVFSGICARVLDDETVACDIGTSSRPDAHVAAHAYTPQHAADQPITSPHPDAYLGVLSRV